jgi:hypothetical protein
MCVHVLTAAPSLPVPTIAQVAIGLIRAGQRLSDPYGVDLPVRLYATGTADASKKKLQVVVDASPVTESSEAAAVTLRASASFYEKNKQPNKMTHCLHVVLNSW